MKIEAILKNIIFLDNGYFKYQEYQNLGIHSSVKKQLNSGGGGQS